MPPGSRNGTSASSIPIGALNHGLKTALAAAKQGPRTGGNPQVGCVILAPSGVILSVGYHRGKGSDHAEVDCLKNLSNQCGGTDLSRCAAIVTLEPCNHQGATAPCVKALLKSGIGSVIWAVDDPNPIAAGGGQALSEQGIKACNAAAAGLDRILIDQVKQHMDPWCQATERKRPWVIAKVAASADGYVAAKDGTSQWITNRVSRAHAHQIRAQVDQIVVGTQTVQSDNPTLSARNASGALLAHQPGRVVVGRRDLDPKLNIFQGPHPAQRFKTWDLEVVLRRLYQQQANFVLLEGGPTLIQAALQANLVDELHLYLAPLLLAGGKKGIGNLGINTLDQGRRLQTMQVKELAGDIFWQMRLVTKSKLATDDAACKLGDNLPKLGTCPSDNQLVSSPGPDPISVGTALQAPWAPHSSPVCAP